MKTNEEWEYGSMWEQETQKRQEAQKQHQMKTTIRIRGTEGC